MKLNMLSKYILLYIMVAVISFIAVSTLCYRIDYANIYRSYTDSLYLQANNIAGQYAYDYLDTLNSKIIENQLKNVAVLGGTRIMFISPNGHVILDTGFEDTAMNEETLYVIEEFDYGRLNGKHSHISNFYGVFDENVLSVYAPIASSFSIKGYVVIHMPESILSDRLYITFNTNYLTMCLVLALSISFLILYLIQIHRPVKDIIKATDEYGKGNFSYRIQTKQHDELGKLALSLDYMASELNEMNEFQQNFLSNISHDFRSPLTSIKGYLEAIEDGTVPPEMTNKYIRIVLFETERLTRLTSNILTLNELDPKSARLEFSAFDLNSIVRHTIEAFEGTCKRKNIKFNLTFAGETEEIWADKSKIQQVLYNLIDNAIKFSHENSYIDITVKEKGNKAQISVKDTGCGIAREEIDKIWDRFYKSDSSRGRDKKGSGLGLSITKEIILAHEENIDVISTPGVGTEFIFTLKKAASSD